MTGVAPFTIVWSNGATGEDITGLTAGTYTVTVTDANGCSATDEVTINDGPLVALTVSGTEVSCLNGNDGTASVSVSGGAAPYTIDWSNGATGEDITGLTAGTYTVTATDANGCSGTGSVTISQPSAIQITLSGSQNSQCGANDGQININVSGGTPGYSYLWSNGATSANLSNLGAGTYSVTVTDANGCTASFGPVSIEEENCCDTAPVVESVVIIEANCGASDGSATISMVGDETDFTYNWSPNVGVANAVGNARTSLPAGAYSVTISSNDPNCPSTVENFTIGTTNGPIATVLSTTPATCNEANGTAVMSNLSYDYQWCNGATGYNPTNLPAGTCQVTITDPATGCVDYRTVVIGTVNPLVIGVTVNNEPECGLANGSATVNVSNGSTNYSYIWSNGATTQTVDGLASGFYCVTVTDNGPTGCTKEYCFTLMDNVPGNATINIQEPVKTSCIGTSDATVIYTVSLGAGFITPASETIVDDLGNVVTNGSLAAGNYCIIVRDANGCLAGQACFEVIEPEQIDLDIAVHNSCDPSPSILITEISGGNAPYTFDWADLPGNNDPMDRTDLAVGSYSLTVTDANGCSVSVEDLNITETCTECVDPVIESVVVIEATCGNADGSATISMVGAESDYTYAWSPNIGTANANGNARTGLSAGSYTVVITPVAPGCPGIIETFTIGTSDGPEAEVVSSTPATCNDSNGSAEMSNQDYEYEWCNGATGYNPTNLPAGECQVTITDPSTGCVDYRTVTIGESNPLQVSVTVNNKPDCGQANGSVTVNVDNGSGNYSYAWSNGGTSQTIDNLVSGSYCVTVTDNGANGCVKEYCFVLTDDVPGAVITVTEPVTTNCVGSADATVDYTITLEAGFAEPATTVIMDAQGNVVANGSLTAGDYCIMVSDANGCIAGQTCFEVIEPEQIDLDIAIHDSCDPTPSISITEISGGTAPYTFDWADITGTDNPMNRTDLEVGSYDLIVSDANGCSVEVNDLDITETCIECIDPIIESIVVVEASCGNSDGSAIISMVGAESDFTYTWSPDTGVSNSTGNARTELPSGSYTVTITSTIPGCPAIIESFTIGTSNGPDAEVLATTPATCNESNGTAVMSNLNYEYEWCNGATGYNPTNLPAGECQVTITDPITGCKDYRTVVIEEFNPLQVSVTVNNKPDCGQANGSVTVNVTNGSTSYNYAWSNGATTQTVDNLSSGLYCVTVTDNGATGCVKEYCFVLTDNVPGAVVTIAEPVTTTCVGTSDATVDYTITLEAGFAEPASVEIIDASGNVVSNGSLSGGEYCIKVTDANGCVAGNICFEVVEPAQIDLDVAVNNLCDPTPGIEVTEVSGGTAPYTFDWADIPGDSNPMDRPDLETGSYDLTVTDINGCSVSVNDLVVVDTCACPPLIISSVVVIESNCGESVGQATVTIADEDNLDLIYEWSSNAVTIGNGGKSITNAEAGTYAVTITVAGQAYCTIIEEFTIGNTDGPEASFQTNGAPCGSTDGTATFSNSDYAYSWSDGGTGIERTDLAAGTYFVTISDPNNPGCIDVKTVVIEEIASFSVSATIVSLPDCGEANGAVTITPSVAGNYSYSWGGNGSVSNLTSGTYQITVTDEDTGCTATTFFTLNDNVPNAVLNVDADATVSCAGSSDGTIDYTYTLPAGFDGPAVEEIRDLNGNLYTNGELVEGRYCIIIKDANGCIAGSDCIQVKSPDQIDVDVAVFNESCGDPGEIQLVEVIGGNGGYNYQWGAPVTSTGTVASNLSAGQYTFTVTDVKGCNVSETVMVNDDPNALSILASPDTIFCEGSAINISVDAPVGTIEWTNAAGEVQGNTAILPVSESGTYYVSVTSGACVENDSVQVVNGSVDVNPMTDNFACEGVSGQLLMIENLDSNDILTYDWSPDELIIGNENTASPELNTSTTGLFELTVEITNQFGCSATEMVEVLIVDSVDTPDQFSNTQCVGTTVDFNIEGSGNYVWYFDANDPTAIGTGDSVSYEYPSGGMYEVTVIIAPVVSCFEPDTITTMIEVAEPPLSALGFDIDLTDCSEGIATLVVTDTSSAVLGDIEQWAWTTSTGLSSGLSAFEFDVTSSQNVEINLVVTTSNGCVDSVTQVVPIDLVDVQINDEVACFETSEILNENGNDQYTYEWSPSQFLDDENAVSPVVTTNDDVTFFVTVTNSAGCTDVDTVQYSVIDEIDLAIGSDGPEFCSNGPVTLSAGSNNATSYIWTDAAGNVLSENADFTDAMPGSPSDPTTYFVQATLEGCTTSDSITISNYSIDLEIEGPGDACPGDTIFLSPIFANDLDALNGATFVWSGDGIIDDQMTDEIMVIANGSDTYTLEVQNEFCSGLGELNVSVTDFSGANAVADPDTIFLSEISTLSAKGDNEWNYEWMSDPSIMTDPSTQDIEVSPEETTEYMVTMTDSLGCVVNRTVTVVVISECEEPFIFFPNAFSPNGDGFNDVLYLRGNGVTEVFFAIYDRWGEKVFESNDQSIGWDGTYKGEELGNDVYGFYLRVRCGNGEEYYKQGNVSLFR